MRNLSNGFTKALVIKKINTIKKLPLSLFKLECPQS